MALGFVIGFLLGSIVTYFIVKGNKKQYDSTIDDINVGLHRLKGMLNDIERDL